MTKWEITLTRHRIFAVSIIVALISILVNFLSTIENMKNIISIFLALTSIFLIWLSLNIAYFHIDPRIIKLKNLLERNYIGTLTLAPSYLVDTESKPLFKAPNLKSIIITHSYHIQIEDITYRGKNILDNCNCGLNDTCSCKILDKRGEKIIYPVVKPDSEITIEYRVDQEKLDHSSSKLYLEIEIHEILFSIMNIAIIFRLKYRVTT